MTSLPLLPAILLLQPAAALAAALLPDAARARRLALAAALATLALCLAALAAFAPEQTGFQMVAELPWIPGLGIHFRLGVDALSLLFLPVAQLLFVAVLLAGGEPAGRHHPSWMLILQTAHLGVFCALDAALFFLFWELALIPLYFLVSGRDGNPRRRQAAGQYVLTMLGGGALVLIAFVIVASGHAEGGVPSFDLRQWLAQPLPPEQQFAIFTLLLLGFGFKLPFVPLHAWLPVLALEGPAGVLALLTGLKLGAFALLRLAVPLAPAAAQELHWLLAGLGTASVLYGALAMTAQTNLRAMLAYASLSHVGLVVLGIASYSAGGAQGALMQLLNFSLASGGLFILAGAAHARLGSTEASALGGAARSMPLLASFFLFFALVGMGLPGTSGFPAELALFVAAFGSHAGAALAALIGAALAAVFLLALYRRAFFGPITLAAVREAADLLPRERRAVLLLALPALVFGLHPAPILDFLAPAARAWAAAIAPAAMP